MHETYALSQWGQFHAAWHHLTTIVKAFPYGHCTLLNFPDMSQRINAANTWLIFVLQRPIEGPSGTMQDLRSFKLILEYIKALPVSSFLMFSGYCIRNR